MLAIRCRVRACVLDSQTRRGHCSEGFLADSSTPELALLSEGSVCLVVVHVVVLVTLAHIWQQIAVASHRRHGSTFAYYLAGALA